MKPSVYLLFRLIVGLLFLQHGLAKLFGFFGENQAELFSLMGLAGIIETFAGFFIAIGILVRTSAFFSACTMLAGYFMAHAPKAFIPMNNGGELALVYLACFLLLMAFGPGKLSLDKALN